MASFGAVQLPGRDYLEWVEIKASHHRPATALDGCGRGLQPTQALIQTLGRVLRSEEAARFLWITADLLAPVLCHGSVHHYCYNCETGLAAWYLHAFVVREIVLYYYLFFSDLIRPSSYLETRDETTGARPWVCILFLFFGPVIGSLTEQGYLYVLSQVIVNVQAVITELVFEHALRIRVKAEMESSEESKGATSPKGSGAVTPTASEADAEASEDADALHASEPTERTAVEASESSTAPTVVAGKKDDKPAGTKESAPSPPKKSKSSNLIGRINNLVTSDLEQIVPACDLLGLFLYAPLQIAFSIIFLYGVLGWR